MKELKCKLIPQFRNGVYVKVPLKVDIEFGAFCLVISDVPGKEYSVALPFEGIEIDASLNEPTAFINKRQLGSINEGDSIIIIPYKPTIATHLLMIVNNQSRIPAGDWSEVVVASTKGKLFDYGSEINFTFPSRLSQPYVISGYIKSGVPRPPVLINEQTKVFIEKKTDFQIAEILNTLTGIKEKRALEYKNQMKNDTFELLALIKANALNSYGQSFEFTADPHSVFNAVQNVIKGYKQFQQQQQYFPESDSFVASASNIFITEKTMDTIAEVQVLARGNTGKLILWVYSQKADVPRKLVIQTFTPQLRSLIDGLKDGPVLVPDSCPSCGFQPLPLHEADPNGMLTCPACSSTLRIPLQFRTE